MTISAADVIDRAVVFAALKKTYVEAREFSERVADSASRAYAIGQMDALTNVFHTLDMGETVQELLE
jgi:hypothetical protein